LTLTLILSDKIAKGHSTRAAHIKSSVNMPSL
jgi:hypothetical protein